MYSDYRPRYNAHYANISFYENQMPALPTNAHIDSILKDWPGDYELLESNHLYIQWLFPNKEKGLNEHSYPLKMEEAMQFQQSPKLKEKMKKAFEMMLDFYGMKLTKNNQFELTKDSDKKLKNLNRKNNHNFQRITRILKALIDCGHRNLARTWLQFLADLIYEEKKLDQAEDNFQNYWMKAFEEKDTRGSETNLQKSRSHRPNLSLEYENTAIASSSKTAEYSKPSLSFSFYKNERPFEPNGDLIENILRYWKNDDKMLEKNPNCMYWLFPFDESKKNLMLTDAEITQIVQTPELNRRVLRAFEMMLNFYGMKLNLEYSFMITSREKLQKLNNINNPHMHHITSILLTLQNLHHEYLIIPWMKFLADLIYDFKYLSNAKYFFENCWKVCLKPKYQKKILDYTAHL